VTGEDLTTLLRAWQRGDRSALERIAPVIHRELHRLSKLHLRGERAGHTFTPTDLIGEAYQQGTGLIAISAERLDDDCFDLRTRILGEFIQKLVNYRLRLAIVGDIARHAERSTALRDFVYEANRGDQVWFVSSIDDLGERLRQADADRA
jgi:hypothetical protein